MQKIVILFILSIYFSSCVSYQAIQAPLMAKADFRVKIDEVDFILYVSCKEYECYFSLIDTLGVPVASKIYAKGKFKSTKFLPPNKLYIKIFVKSLEMLKQNLKTDDLRLNKTQIRIERIESLY